MRGRIRTWLCMAILLLLAFNAGRSIEYAQTYESRAEKREVFNAVKEIEKSLIAFPVIAMRGN